MIPGAVLLPIAERQKRPEISGWQKLTFADTQDPKYQQELREATNTGVLLGQASGNLCAIDADDDSYLIDFLELNSHLARFATQGKRGGQVWFYVDGVYPHGVKKLKTNDGKAWGEFRADGGQSVIRGIHPDGMHYRWLGMDSPATIKFDRHRAWPLRV